MPDTFDLDAAPAAPSGGSDAPAGAGPRTTAGRPDLRVPKLRVKARVRLRGEEPRTIALHLAERAALHAGPERPSDLLAGSRDFLPVEGPEGRVLFLSTHAIDVLTVPAGMEAEERGSRAPELDPSLQAQTEVVLHLDDGTEVEGRIRFVPAPGRGRLLDFLNGPAPFIPVWEGELVHLVNKSRVAWIAATARDEGADPNDRTPPDD